MRRLLALLAAVTACGAPDAELSRAVRAYDDALVRAYASSDAAGMEAVAGEKEVGRIRALVDLKAGAMLTLVSELESFEVTKAVARGDAATVETRERWRYHDRRLAPGAPPGPELVSRMAMRYELLRDGGRWRVESVTTLSSEYLEGRPNP